MSSKIKVPHDNTKKNFLEGSLLGFTGVVTGCTQANNKGTIKSGETGFAEDTGSVEDSGFFEDTGLIPDTVPIEPADTGPEAPQSNSGLSK